MKKKKVLVLLITAFIGYVTYAGIYERLQKAIDQNAFEKVEKIARKSISKDTLNPGVRYFLSKLYLQSAYQHYNIDSALFYINGAVRDYQRSSIKSIEKLTKSGIDSGAFAHQRALIADAAFSRALDSMTVSCFTTYLSQYDGSVYYARATYMRDSLAFDHAQQKHTWQGYQTYFQTYPESEFAGEARARYQKLIFQDYTKDDRLRSYQRFLKEHPETPFRREAEEMILKKSTLSNSWDSYITFLNSYPETSLRKEVGDILYYLTKERHFDRLNEVLLLHAQPDSLEELYLLEKEILFPIYDNQRYGFMSVEGELVIDPVFEEIGAVQYCGKITSEWLEIIREDQPVLIDRSGHEITSGKLHSHVSSAIKLVNKHGKNYLYHASGFMLTNEHVEDASVWPNGWICYRHENSWGLLSPTGYELLPPLYQSIKTVGPFVILETEEKYAISSFEELAQEEHPIPDPKYDDYEFIQDSLVFVYSADREGLLNQHLNYMIPLDQHQVYVSGKYWYFQDDDGYYMISRAKKDEWDDPYKQISMNEGWLGLKHSTGWELRLRQNEASPLKNIDSLKLLSSTAVYLEKGDTTAVLFTNNSHHTISKGTKIQVLSASTGVAASYLVLTDNKKTDILGADGSLLFSGKYEEVSLFKDSLFQIKMNGKMGLKRANGETALSPKYDMLDDQGNLIFLLKDGKIGCMDLSSGVIIPADYEARMEQIGTYYAVKKADKTGLINSDNKEVLPPDYDQILAWNDSSCWVRTGAQWSLIDLRDQQELLKDVQSVRPWIAMPDQQLCIVLGTNGFGLYSNHYGEVLPMEYNDILNVGTDEHPVFFAEQHLKAAAFFVVTYFDIQGNTIRSQAFRPEEYDHIYCDQ